MPNERVPIEVFYSYAHEDELLRNELEKHLSILHRQGLISSWHDRKIVAGTDWAKAIDTHLETASLILLLISSDFLASDYCYGVEMKRALERHKAKDARVIPILLRPVEWKGALFEHLQALPTDARSVTEWDNLDTAFRNVARGIRQAIEDLSQHGASVAHVTLPSIWNIPYPRNPVFTGRSEILKRIHTQLQTNQVTALSQAQAISGLGGIGKTQIAVEYAYQHAREYEAVLWTLADTRESLVSGYITIAALLDLPQKNEQDPTVTIEAVKNWLQSHGSWLLILDNADDLTMVREFIPSMFGGHLLLTTRVWTMGRLAKRLEVETMTVDMGALLLLRLIGLVEPDASLETASASDVKTAREICGELGGLPLALDQAGAYIEEAQCGLTGYLNLYRARHVELLNARGGLVDDHPEPVATTWSISFKKVEERNLAAADLLCFCAFLAPDVIPEEMITRNAEHFEPPLQQVASDPLLLNAAIAALGAYSLVRRNPSDQTLSIHRLVQAVLKDTMDDEMRKQWTERVIRSVDTVFPDVEFETWTQCERYLPHALVCAELVKKENSVFPEAGDLLNGAGWYLKERARYNEAEPLIQQGLAIRQQCLEPMHLGIGQSLSTLGYLYIDQGRLTETEPVWQRALSIYEQQLGSDHPNTATSLSNLANLYRAQGKYEMAEPLFQRALAIDEQAYGKTHPDVAIDLNSLAVLYYTQGKYEMAEPLYQRALAIKEQKLGAMHPATATSLNNLALLYQHQGKYETAEPLHKRALSIHEKAYGLDHPDVAIDLHNLATLYYEQGKYTEAEPLFKRALLIREQTLGETHPDTQSMREWYISLLRKMGRNEEATTLETTG